MASRRREKAKRSCSNCQRGHKTCGNKRPCQECVRRGIPNACVDGYRKPPKYLRRSTSERIAAELHRIVPVPQVRDQQGDNNFNVAYSRNENAEFGPALEAAGNDRSYGETNWRDSPPQFIDPSLLHIESQILGLESSTEMGIYWDKRSYVPDFSPYLQQSLATDFLSPNWEQTSIQESHLPPDIIVRDDMSELQASRTNFHDLQGAKACQRGVSGYGIAISSGWASTFFPY